jgi:putative ABC transport system permease protein
VRSFARLQTQSFGLDNASVVTAQIQLPGDRYRNSDESGRFLRQLVDELAAMPGVKGAAAVNTLPLTGFNARRPYNLPGHPPEERMAEFRVVTPGYFAAMRIPLKRGRVFDDRDRRGGADVVIVNESVARRLWPGVDPVGQTLVVPDGLTPTPRTVVGVVGDTRHHDLAKAPEPEIYRPAYQAYWPFFGLVIRTDIPADRFERPLRAAGARIDRTVPLGSIQPFDEIAASTWAWRRASMALMMIFAAGALLLAAVGVYGVTAYAVAQRGREFGVRMALGARPGDIGRSVVREALMLSGGGLLIGLALAAAGAGVLRTLLFGISPLDAGTFTAIAVLTAACAVTASAVPALAAARIDPARALRRD